MAQRSRRSRNFSVQQVLEEILGDSDSEVEEFSSSDDSVDEEDARGDAVSQDSGPLPSRTPSPSSASSSCDDSDSVDEDYAGDDAI